MDSPCGSTGRSAAALGLAWLTSRAVLMVLLDLYGVRVLGDLRYFDRSVAGVGPGGFGDVLVEYPAPAAVLVSVLRAVATGLGGVTLTVGVVALMLLTDAGLTWVLARRAPTAAVWAWIVGPLLLGPVTYARLDLLPGAMVAVALLYGPRRPGTVGFLLAAGTGLKLWPAAVLPALSCGSSRPRRLWLLAGLTGAAAVVISVLGGGWPRLLSPLAYQRDRGLQIESIAATPLMLARVLAPERWDVARSAYLAFEIDGPATTIALHVTTVASLTWLAASMLLAHRWWAAAVRTTRSFGPAASSARAWVTLATTAGAVASSKVFSPQYLLWLLPVAAAALVTTPADRRLARWIGLLLLTCGLTQIVFPISYPLLVHTGVGLGPATAVLVLRNLMLLALTAQAYRMAFAATRVLGPQRVQHLDSLPGQVDHSAAPEPVRR